MDTVILSFFGSFAEKEKEGNKKEKTFDEEVSCAVDAVYFLIVWHVVIQDG